MSTLSPLLDSKFVRIFVKSPVTVLLLLAVLALAYSQHQNDLIYREQIQEYREELKVVRAELSLLQNKVFSLRR